MTQFKLQARHTFCLSLLSSVVTAWSVAVLLAGRALPWQVSRGWLLAFVLCLVLAFAWWFHFFNRARRIVVTPADVSLACLAGTVPYLVPSLGLLAASYLSDSFNNLLSMPHWTLPFSVGAILLLVLTDTFQRAVLLHLRYREAGIVDAVCQQLSVRQDLMMVASLMALGAVQAAAAVIPIGDDIWHYTETADALLAGAPYPLGATPSALREAGMAQYYPALPLLPILLAGSFSIFGRNLVGVAMPNILATALFPIAMFLACKAVTGSRLTAYLTAVLLFLFPIYQIHVLGTAEPDTLFVVLLLLGAFFAVGAGREGRTEKLVGTGISLGLASLTRHEGTAYAAVLFASLLALSPHRGRALVAIGTYLAVLAPFSLYYHSLTGAFWPSTFGRSILGWQYLEANLTTISWTSLDWYAQAIGVDRNSLVLLVITVALLSAIGALVLLKRIPAAAGIPIAGLGNLAAGFFMHPFVVYSGFPVEFLRHISYGIPFAVLGLACSCSAGISWLSGRLQRVAGNRWGELLVVGLLLLACSGLYYESERLAKPEWYFQGKASLLWTGSYYLLTDVMQHPVPLPMPGDTRPGEQIRDELTSPIENVNLRRVNLSEPYHWSSLLIALFGLTYAATSPRGNRRRR